MRTRRVVQSRIVGGAKKRKNFFWTFKKFLKNENKMFFFLLFGINFFIILGSPRPKKTYFKNNFAGLCRFAIPILKANSIDSRCFWKSLISKTTSFNSFI